MLARLKRVRGMSDDEKSVHALGLAATPEERWQLNEDFIRSLGYWKPLKRKKSVLKLERILTKKQGNNPAR